MYITYIHLCNCIENIVRYVKSYKCLCTRYGVFKQWTNVTLDENQVLFLYTVSMKTKFILTAMLTGTKTTKVMTMTNKTSRPRVTPRLQYCITTIWKGGRFIQTVIILLTEGDMFVAKIKRKIYPSKSYFFRRHCYISTLLRKMKNCSILSVGRRISIEPTTRLRSIIYCYHMRQRNALYVGTPLFLWLFSCIISTMCLWKTQRNNSFYGYIT